MIEKFHFFRPQESYFVFKDIYYKTPLKVYHHFMFLGGAFATYHYFSA